MKTFVLPVVLALASVGSAVVRAQTPADQRPGYFGTAVPGANLPPAPASTVPPQSAPSASPGTTPRTKEAQAFEQMITGSVWEFPWGDDNKMKSIEFRPNGVLILGWHRSAKGFKWRVPKEGMVEVYAYMDGRTYDIMRVPSNTRTAALTRDGKQIAIIKRKL